MTLEELVDRKSLLVSETHGGKNPDYCLQKAVNWVDAYLTSRDRYIEKYLSHHKEKLVIRDDTPKKRVIGRPAVKKPSNAILD